MPNSSRRTFRTGLLIGVSSLAVAVAAAAVTYERYDTQTLKRTVRRGELAVRRQHRLARLLQPDDKGNWSGFDVDFCRAIAAAIFNDPGKVRFVPLDANERFTRIAKAQDRRAVAQLDLEHVARNRTMRCISPPCPITTGRDSCCRKSRNIDSGLELDGSKVCVQGGTTTQLNLADYFRANNMKYEEMKFAKPDDVLKAYESGAVRRLNRRRVAALLRSASSWRSRTST